MKELQKKLKDEGFAHVYEWKDTPGTLYPPHEHKGKVSFYVTEGNITLYFGKEETIVAAGERMNVPPGTTHTAIVGPQGCSFVIGEEIEGDSQ